MEQGEEITVDPKYLQGFNNGYLLAQNEPDLATKIAAYANDHNPYFKGFVGGKSEYEKETREWAKSFSKGAPAKDERELGKER
jgi:hypothetical protein